VLALTVLVLAVSTASAHPPAEPEHGLNNSSFYPLWAGDDDVTSLAEAEQRVGDGASEIEELAALSDIPFESPPRAVERWNALDREDFPKSGRSASFYPADADLSQGRFIADAHASIFAVQPSTRARLTDGDQPLYVGPNGSVLGTIDYRIEVPAGSETETRNVQWRLLNHRIDRTRLLVNGRVESTTPGSHTPTLTFSELDSYPGNRFRLKLASKISVTLEKTVRECLNQTTANGSENTSTGCTEWNTSTETRTDTVDISDRIDVTVYSLSVSGYQSRYPDGDLGLVVYKNQPWLGFSSPAGDVRGSWNFYSSRDPDWDQLSRSTESGTSKTHSPLHPVQVSAYPSAFGPSTDVDVKLLDSFGEKKTAPTLPSNIQVDVSEEPYIASYGLATRLQTDADITDVTALGLVRGVEAPLHPESFFTVLHNRSALAVDIRNSTDSKTTIQVTLRDAETGEPIETDGQQGHILLNGERFNTSADGTVTATLSTGQNSFEARYVPGNWWETSQAYAASSDVAYERMGVLGFVSVLYRIAIPIGVLLILIFIVARMTGWDIWPPWGRQ
jgi:hypothetical protein